MLCERAGVLCEQVWTWGPGLPPHPPRAGIESGRGWNVGPAAAAAAGGQTGEEVAGKKRRSLETCMQKAEARETFEARDKEDGEKAEHKEIWESRCWAARWSHNRKPANNRQVWVEV